MLTGQRELRARYFGKRPLRERVSWSAGRPLGLRRAGIESRSSHGPAALAIAAAQVNLRALRLAPSSNLELSRESPSRVRLPGVSHSLDGRSTAAQEDLEQPGPCSSSRRSGSAIESSSVYRP